MHFIREGLPEEDEVVICTVKKILHNSVFVDLDEYKNVEGMLHISEIAPGRIRNIRDYVKIGKKIVCKILRVDQRYHHVDVSLRRVSISLRQRKVGDYKQELRSEKLVVSLAKQNNIPEDEIYKKLVSPLLEKFGSLYLAFMDILKNDGKNLTEIQSDLSQILVKLVKEKTKLPEVKIESVVKLTNYDSDGVNKIKDIIKKAVKAAEAKNYKIEFSYISAPNYRLKTSAKDYKEAEGILKETIANLENYTKETRTSLEWQRKS